MKGTFSVRWRQRALLADIDAEIRRLAPHGYLLESALTSLEQRYADRISPAELRQRVDAVLAPGPEESRPDPGCDPAEWFWRAASSPDNDPQRVTAPVQRHAIRVWPPFSSSPRSGRQGSGRPRVRLLRFGPVFGLGLLAAGILAWHAVRAETPHSAAARVLPTATDGAISTPTVPAPPPPLTRGAVGLLLERRVVRWDASLECACDRGLALIETGSRFQRDKAFLIHLHQTHAVERVHEGTWTVEQLHPQSPTSLEVLVVGTRGVRRSPASATTRGPPPLHAHQLIYWLTFDGANWKVDRIQHRSAPVPPASSPTSVDQESGPQIEQDPVWFGYQLYLRTWNTALATSDPTPLPNVLTSQALAQAKTIVQEDRAAGQTQQVQDLTPPQLLSLHHDDATHATIDVGREFSLSVVNASTGLAIPGRGNPDETATQRYTMVKVGGVWKVASGATP